MLRKSCLGVLLLLGGLAVPAYGQVKLEWKFKEGDTFWVETTSKTRQTRQAMGRESKSELDQTTVWRFTVLKAAADATVIEQVLESLDAKANAADPKLAERMKGARFALTLDAKREITRFEGYDDFLDRLANGNDTIKKVLGNILSEDAIKQTAAEAFTTLPGKPVKQGDKWQRKTSVALGPLGSLDVDNNLTYEGKAKIDDKEAEKITQAPNVTFTPPKAAGLAGFPTIAKADLKADAARGTIYFDAAAGRMVQAEMKTHLKGTMTLTGAGKDVEADIDLEQTVTTRYLDKSPVK
jgi:Family of unknown function (DUF6263)